MWSLKPFKSPPSTCPNCSYENAGFNTHIFTGVHILGTGKCASCQTLYFHNWPLGHGAEFPITFTQNGLEKYPPKSGQWMAKPLINALKKDLKVTASIRRIVRKNITGALLLNCLDPCYGHIIWKLFNTFHYQDILIPQGVVVLIPENCIWMVPEYVAEVWALDLPLKDLNFQIESLDAFIEEVKENYTSLQLLPVHTHVEHENIDFFQYFHTKPFQLSQFSRTSPCITIIWREDRFWLQSRLEEWLHLVMVKLSIRWFKAWFLYRQSLAFKGVAKQVKSAMPTAMFKVAGLGSWGDFSGYMEDLRQPIATENIEKTWCETYAHSHLVVGVHGSNMLIPTALSAGFIELLPAYKIPFISEDILLKHPPRFQTFLGRHLDMLASPRSVGRHIISVLTDFAYLYKNTSALK